MEQSKVFLGVCECCYHWGCHADVCVCVKWVCINAQGIFNTLDRAGQLVEQTIEQLYSEAAGKFLADRFVTGTCPKCQYEVCLHLLLACSAYFTNLL